MNPYDRLDSFSRLGEDEDWEGRPITAEALHTSRLLLEHLPGTPSLVPTPKGGVQLEYTNTSIYAYYEIEVEPNGEAGMLWKDASDVLELDRLSVSTLVELATRFVEECM